MSGVRLSALASAFEGTVPAVVATASAGANPNVTFLSKVHLVDDEHVALSNQFFSKTTRNLAENPRASILVITPGYEQYRLGLEFERTVRTGPIFDALAEEVATIAALEGMQDVFALRAADVYRVSEVVPYPELQPRPPEECGGIDPAALAELGTRLSRCPDLDTLVEVALDSIAELFAHEHSLLLLHDELGERLFTIASRGYPASGIGSEVGLGEGVIGMAAARGRALRVGNLHQLRKYSRSVRRSFEDEGAIGPGREIELPRLERANSQLAAPAILRGELRGVLAVEEERALAYDRHDEAVLGLVAGQLAAAIELEAARERAASEAAATARDTPAASPGPAGDAARETRVRFFPVDGSTFLGTDYLIKGVAGRLLWSLLREHASDGREDFTCREVRLDPTLELPPGRDNLDSRLVLLKRRLAERDAPIRIEKTGRGRFRLRVDGALRLERAGA